MRFILSALLATALFGALATADVHQGQQATFRLEARHERQDYRVLPNNQHHHLDHKVASQHLKHSEHAPKLHSKKIDDPHKSHSKQIHGCTVAKGNKNEDIELAFHRKVASHSKNSALSEYKEKSQKKKSQKHTVAKGNMKKSQKNKKNQKHVVAKGNKGKSQKNKKNQKHIAVKGSMKKSLKNKKNQKHVVAKDNKKKSQKNKKIQKHVVAKGIRKADTELAFHRKITRQRKSRTLGDTKKADADLAFHLKISRQRKDRNLGEKDKSHLIKTQDIKN